MYNLRKPKDLSPIIETSLKMEDCVPEIIFAKVTEIIETDMYRRTRLEYDGSIDKLDPSPGKVNVRFSYEIGDRQFYVRETFEIGEVLPKLGQWVRGVLVRNQWGSYHFITTHVLKSQK